MINYTFLKEVFMSTFLLSYFPTFLLSVTGAVTGGQARCEAPCCVC